MPTVLSTKRLNLTQKNHLFGAGIGLVEYDALIIQALKTKIESRYIENAIFTSQNAVKLAIEKKIKIKNAFCVGDKTAALIKQNNISLKAQAEKASALAYMIIKKYPEKSFDFFCSKQRRDELPALLNQKQIEFTEHHLYKTVCNFKSFPHQFDAILCFSPLGTKTYYDMHTHNTPAICIGQTTAEMAKLYTNEVLIASKTSIESVLIKTIKYFNKVKNQL